MTYKKMFEDKKARYIKWVSAFSKISIYLVYLNYEENRVKTKQGYFNGSFFVFSYDSGRKKEFYKRNLYWNKDGHAFFVFLGKEYFIGDFQDTRF